MSMLDVFGSDEYTDGRTKQSFKDSTDINKLLAKAAKGESITHLAKYGAVYGDFSDMPDLLEARRRLAIGQEIFSELPGEIRREFNQSPAAFFAFVNDPTHKDDLARLIPGLVERGTQLPALDRLVPEGIVEPVVEPVVAPVLPAVPPVVDPPTTT